MSGRRSEVRYAANEQGVGVYIRAGNEEYKCHLRDVSSHGAQLMGSRVPPEGASVAASIETDGDRPIPRNGTVCHSRQSQRKGRAGVEFSRPLTESDLEAMVEGYANLQSPKLILARSDCDQVNEEIRGIQVCRSRMFMGTMAAIGAIGMGTAILISRLRPPPSPAPFMDANAPWLLFSSFLGSLFLGAGILTSVEKARAINVRKGFLAAMAEYLVKGRTPERYFGWAWLKSAQSECGTRRRAEVCPFVATVKNQGKQPTLGVLPPPQLPESCWTLGKYAGSKICSAKRLFPSMLDSYMSLSGGAYSMMFFLVCGTALFSVAWIVSRFGAGSLSGAAVGMANGVGLILGAGKHFWTSYRRKTTRSKTALHDGTDPVLRFARIVTAVGFLLMILAVIVGLAAPWPVARFAALAGLAAFVSYLGGFFLNQLNKVRRGLYSVDSLHWSWRFALRCCAPVPTNSTRAEVEDELRRRH